MKDQPAVLYVEDNPQSCKLMKLMLVGRLGLKNVMIWQDSVDFCERLNTLEPKPDVVFLDIYVGPYNGFEMLLMLRQHEHFSETPIVALTASVMSEEVHQLRSAGFDGCIGKPIDLETFPDALELVLAKVPVWTILS